MVLHQPQTNPANGDLSLAETVAVPKSLSERLSTSRALAKSPDASNHHMPFCKHAQVLSHSRHTREYL